MRPTRMTPRGSAPQLSRRTMLRGVGLLGVLPAAGLLSACGDGGGAGAPAGGSGGTQQWRIGLPELKSDSVFQAMGVAKGFYEEVGLAGELVPLASGTTTVRAVLSGELEIGAAGPSGVFAAMESGAPLLITGSVLAKVPHLFYVHKDINALEDLTGREVGGGQPGALLHQLAYATFLKAGLDPDAVTYVNVGGSPDVFSAIVGGTIPAGVAGSEYTEQLKADPNIPVKVLAPIREYLPDYLRNVDFVSQRLLQEDRDRVTRGLSAYIRGARYAVENRDEAIEWAMKETGASEAGATLIWEEFTANKLVNVDYALTQAQIDVSQEVSVATGVLGEMMPYEDITDATIADEAKKLL
jgi:ABC-type nitrate/sulfonate/bicarbonate transport system substrate-binding protein